MPLPRRTPRRVWTCRAVAAIAVIALIVFLTRLGETAAGAWGSAIAAIAAVTALFVPYAFPLTSTEAPPDPPAPGQHVIDSSVEAPVIQISGVAGNVHVGSGPHIPSSPGTPPSPRDGRPAPVGPQRQIVQDSTVRAPITQIGGVGGDVNIQP